MSQTLFYMWGPYRELLISKHLFYLKQAEERVLFRFNDLEKEADDYQETWLANRFFDSESEDPVDGYEDAFNESLNFYLDLVDMRDSVYGAILAGMFHAWEKQLREWVAKEVAHWKPGNQILQKIWKMNFHDLIEIFKGFGWSIKTKSYYQSLDKYRLMVNVYKRGEGPSMKELQKKYPSCIPQHEAGSLWGSKDHRSLKIDASHLVELSDAIIAFWNDVPERIREEANSVFPDWLNPVSAPPKNKIR